jgi:glycosyltransferase involved in cell wall biosynthesis
MKVLIYSHFFAPSVGGVETIVLSLARGLAALRSSDGTPEFEITLATETVQGTFDDSSLAFPVVRQLSLLRLWDLVRASDLTHVAGPALAPLCLCFLARRPAVVEHHGYQAICPNGLLVHRPDGSICPGHFVGRNYRECVRCLRQESSHSKSWAAMLLEFPRNFFVRRAAANLAVSNHSLNRCALPNSAVIYHGIEDPLESEPPRGELPSSSGEVCFAYVGRLVSEKGIPVLLEASRLLRDEGYSFLVRLIGDGPVRSELEAIIARDHLESCVQLTGFLTGAVLAETLRDVRVVVMPSVWEETAGLAAIEQMMRGRLVIAAAIGGLSEVVGSCGLTFRAGDARALALQMSSVLQNPSIVDTLGCKARDRALQLFRREQMIDEHARLYRKVVHDWES